MKVTRPITDDELRHELTISSRGIKNSTSDRGKNLFTAYENWISVRLGIFNKKIVDSFSDEVFALEKFLMFLALKLTHDIDDAKDLVQEVTIRSINKKHLFDSEKGLLKNWLGVILKNEFLSGKRKKTVITQSYGNVEYMIADVDEYDYDRDEEVANLKLLINKLSPKHQRVVNLRIEGMSFREVGVEIGADENHAKQIFFRAKEKMKKLNNK